MANRPSAYGLTGEVQRKIRDKYDISLEQEARLWLEAVIGAPLAEGVDSNEPLGPDNFHTVLKDGVILCHIMNQLHPGAVKKITETRMPFKQMENISHFLAAAESYGVSKTDLFQTVDLFEKQNMVQVVNSIHALGRAAQKNGYSGPYLGPKEAVFNPRNFDDEKMKAGATVIGLQMGSNKGASQAGMNFGKTRAILD